MINKFISVITDFRLTILLLALFAISCAVATFIENDFGTAAARHLIYNAKWFESIIVLLMFSGIGNIIKYKMYKKSKLPIFIFHLAFILIIIGAAITRYTGFEGTMHIREGESSRFIVSSNTYLQFKVDNKDRQIEIDKKLFINPLFNKAIDLDIKFLGEDISIAVSDVIVSAKDTLISSDNGKDFLEIITFGQQGMVEHYIADSSSKSLNGLLVSFNDNRFENAVQINSNSENVIFNTPFNGTRMSMDNRETDILDNNTNYELKNRHLYVINGIPLVYKMVHKNVELRKISGSRKDGNGNNILELEINHEGNIHNVNLAGGKGSVSPKTTFSSGDLNFTLAYGSKYYRTPFSIQLDDFRLKRYPGSNSPSAYESEVTLFDKRVSGGVIKHLIHMNNVLDYDGYRFFQASYDQDELGSILSVNHDYWGTKVTYLGYLLLIIGMVLTPFTRKSRFKGLGNKVKKLQLKRSSINTVILIVTTLLANNIVFAQSETIGIDVKHTEKFGKILVQDYSGRIKPIHTQASEILRKVSGKEIYNELNSAQVLLGMMQNPSVWHTEPIIKVKHPELKKKLNVVGTQATFIDFFDEKLNYILYDDVTIANRKKPGARNKYDKDVLAVDERLNICHAVFEGELLRIFPLQNDPNNSWYTSKDFGMFNSTDSVFVKTGLSYYFKLIDESIISGDWSTTDEMVGSIITFQQKYGAAIIPTTSKINLEIIYNKTHIFKRLFKYYLLIGLILLVVLFIDIFKSTRLSKVLIKYFSYGLMALFALHTIGLGVRWYIGGYAPWSNAYESMIYIGWATILAGFLFSKTSKMTMAATSILTSLILMVAHLNWLDPEITPLVPVLKSYWLMIHVAIITASYGFLGLGALLGFINLVLMSIWKEKYKQRINEIIAELTHINEMTITIGLFMAAIGTFLGGVWANESWGRYWGWDPKETWALIIVLTYAIILHLRFIPKTKNKYIFNLASVLGFSTVIMTYFGVNYLLSGLHSYAAGDPMPIPNFVYYALGVIGIFASTAYINYRKTSKNISSG